MKLTPHHPFRSARARERYLKLYDERARSWPLPSEERTVEGAYGSTFMRISGPTDAPPLVLLPSASAPSLSWRHNIEAFSASFRVFALDNIYDFGRSVFTRPMKTADDFTAWLAELFDSLGLADGVNLVGMSYGAWLTSQCLLRLPERLARAVMIAPPATLIQLPGAWAWYGITALIPHRWFMRNMLRWMMPVLAAREDAASRALVDELIEDAFVGLRCFKLKMPATPTVLTDEELGRIQTPTLFLVGEHEVIYRAADAVQRLADAAPQIEAAIVPDAGHDLLIVQAELVNEKVLEFLTRP